MNAVSANDHRAPPETGAGSKSCIRSTRRIPNRSAGQGFVWGDLLRGTISLMMNLCASGETRTAQW